MQIFILAVSWICRVAILMIVLEAIMSWFVTAMPDPLLRFYGLLRAFTDPLVAPFRVLTRRFAYSIGIDFSPILAIFAIQIIERVLIMLAINL